MFLYPALLTALALIALPILIHLINLFRHRRVEWAAMEFLLASFRKHSKWIRLREALLLLCRIAIVALIVLAAAVPLVSDQWGRILGGQKTNLIFLLDDSYSMRARSGESTCFEQAKSALLQFFAEQNISPGQTVTIIAFSKPDAPILSAPVDSQLKETTDVARETGYSQYFYYAYSLCQTYYVNTRQDVHAQALLQEMMNIASRRKDAYGLWEGSVYLAKLYQHQNDYFNARKYLLRAVEIHENTEDESIRKQSITHICCDLSDTYEFGTDSARFYIRKAEDFAKTHYDSIRVNYYKARLAAYDKRIVEYHEYRDFCLNDHEFTGQIRYGDLLLYTVDAILEGAPEKTVISRAEKVMGRPQMIFIRSLAIAYHRQDIATWMGSRIIVSFYSDISKLNDMKMEEMSASLKQHQTTMELERQKSINRMLLIALCVVGAALLTALAALLLARKKNSHKS